MAPRRELFHPARVGGFAVGIVAGIGLIAMGLDLHTSPRLRAWHQGKQAIAYPGP